jgi:hypothetical protein
MSDNDFFRTRVLSNFHYHIDGVGLNRTNRHVKDLNILFDTKLKFDYHINNIKNRSNNIIGFIIRNCSDFTDKHALKSLFCSLVHSIC